MTLVQILKDGDTYKVLANPDAPAGDAVKDGDSLVVDTHAVTMTFTPQPNDQLQLEFSGEMFKTAGHDDAQAHRRDAATPTPRPPTAWSPSGAGWRCGRPAAARRTRRPTR